MTKIHPTALVDPDTEIHPSVRIGPYSVVERGVTIGADTIVGSSVRIYRGTRIGRNNRIDHGCVLGCLPQDLSFDESLDTRLEIGDRNRLREGVNISRATDPQKPTRIGSDNYLMGNVHIGHDCRFGDHNIVVNGAVIGGHVQVSHHVFVSGLVAIHQFCRIGEFAMLAGLAKIVKDVPPFTIADGNPASLIGTNVVGLRRNDFSAGQRQAIKRAYRILYRSGLNISQALERLAGEAEGSAEVGAILEFFRTSSRGVLSHR